MNRPSSWPSGLLVICVGLLSMSASVIPSSAQVMKGKKTTSPPAETVIAVQDHEVPGVEVALLDIKRTSGDTVTIKWQYRNKTNEKKPLSHGYTMGMDSFRFARDAYFLDNNRKKYVSPKDAQDHPLGAKHDLFKFSIVMAPKQTVVTWAKFQAPPSDVQSVTIYLPGAPPFEDIPLK